MLVHWALSTINPFLLLIPFSRLFFFDTQNSLNLFRVVFSHLLKWFFFLSPYCVYFCYNRLPFFHYYYHSLHLQMYHLRFYLSKPFFSVMSSIEWHTNWWMIDENFEMKPFDRYFVLVTTLFHHSFHFQIY